MCHNHTDTMTPNQKEPIQNMGTSSKTHSQVAYSPYGHLVWRNVLLFASLHMGAFVGLYQLVFMASWTTVAFTWLCYVLGGLGITAGAHRLWAHRSYKAAWPLRLVLMLCQTLALQNDVIEWSRDHRGHHKWSDTDADPHNSNFGFFFSHMGWLDGIRLLCRKHPHVIEKGRTLDLTDLTSDPILRFQRRYYKPLAILICFIVPSVIPWIGWNESFWVAYFTAMTRYAITLHCTWMVNSVAHRFGNQPYDKFIEPRQSPLTAWAALGEGWHNYHHAFPHDYKTAETPYTINFTTFFIDSCALLGLVSGRKSVSPQVVMSKAERTGDGTNDWTHSSHQ